MGRSQVLANLEVERARAVEACHEVQVMHRDIKPANCIMCLGQQESMLELKLADVGNSVVVSAGPVSKVSFKLQVSFKLHWATTPQYCAPELLSGFHAFKGDVWSIGVICSELLHTQPGESFVNTSRNLFIPSMRRWARGHSSPTKLLQLLPV